MRFWIILILVIGGATYGLWHTFSGITGVGKKEKEKPKMEAKVPTSPKVAPGSTQKSPRESKHTPPVIELPVARNSVKFNHRPVPTNEQLEFLTRSADGQKENKEVIKRPVVAVSDVPTNTVLLYGDLVEVERLAEALKSMDQVISTCHLKTWVVFVRADRQRGFDMIAQIVTGSNSFLNASLGGGVFDASAGIEHLQLSLNASSARGSLEIVDQPYMQLLHGQTSSISTLQEIAIPSTTSNQGVTETSIEFKQVGLTLDIVPWFLAKNRVRLQVTQKNGVVGATRQIAGNDIPELSTQSLKTSAELRMGQVMVLGGVESVQRERSKGWLNKKDIRKVGHLYIVAAIYSTIPKARPVIDLGPDMPLNPRGGSAKGVRAPFLPDGPGLLPCLPTR